MRVTVTPHIPSWSNTYFGSLRGAVAQALRYASNVPGGMLKGSHTAAAYLGSWLGTLKAPAALLGGTASFRVGPGVREIAPERAAVIVEALRATGRVAVADRLADEGTFAVDLERDAAAVATAYAACHQVSWLAIAQCQRGDRPGPEGVGLRLPRADKALALPPACAVQTGHTRYRTEPVLWLYQPASPVSAAFSVVDERWKALEAYFCFLAEQVEQAPEGPAESACWRALLEAAKTVEAAINQVRPDEVLADEVVARVDCRPQSEYERRWQMKALIDLTETLSAGQVAGRPADLGLSLGLLRERARDWHQLDLALKHTVLSQPDHVTTQRAEPVAVPA